jgi:hypothetical protein
MPPGALRAMMGATGDGPPPELRDLMMKAERAHDVALAHVAILTLGIARDYPGQHNCDLEASKLLLRSLNHLSGKNEKKSKGGSNDEEDGA